MIKAIGYFLTDLAIKFAYIWVIVAVILWFVDDSKGFEEWQRPFCRLYRSETLNCQDYLSQHSPLQS